MKLGFHVSISGGFDATLEKAQTLGCEAIQIFVKNPRSWAQRTLLDKDIEAFGRLSAILPVYAHLSYLPNLAKIDEDDRNLSGLLHETSLCTRLGIKYLVAHPGSHSDRVKGAQLAARAVNRVHDEYDVSILIENTAGQGNALGTSIEDMARIYEDVGNRDKTLFCIDTAHLFQSGYRLTENSGWDGFLNEFARTLGIEKIGFFHLNDSKSPRGARADRHWHIGEGEIGLAFFKQLLKDKRFAHLAGVMETPKMGNMDEMNMEVMRSLLPPLVPGSSS